VKRWWIAGASGGALEVWAVARALEELDRLPVPLMGVLVVAGPPEFDPERLAVREESEFLARADPMVEGVVLAVGNPQIRSRMAVRFSAAGFRFPTLVHPTAVIGPRVLVGEGSVLMAQAVLETDVTVGPHVLINVGASVAHNGEIGACSSLGPGVRLGGWVRVGDRCDLGVACCVRPRTTLGPDTVVGAGAAVVKDHLGGMVLVGVPARPLKRSEDVAGS